VYGHVWRPECCTKWHIKTSSQSFEGVEPLEYLGTTLMDQNFIRVGILDQIQDRECLLSFGAESFVFQFATTKYKD